MRASSSLVRSPATLTETRSPAPVRDVDVRPVGQAEDDVRGLAGQAAGGQPEPGGLAERHRVLVEGVVGAGRVVGAPAADDAEAVEAAPVGEDDGERADLSGVGLTVRPHEGAVDGAGDAAEPVAARDPRGRVGGEGAGGATAQGGSLRQAQPAEALAHRQQLVLDVHGEREPAPRRVAADAHVLDARAAHVTVAGPVFHSKWIPGLRVHDDAGGPVAAAARERLGHGDGPGPAALPRHRGHGHVGVELGDHGAGVGGDAPVQHLRGAHPRAEERPGIRQVAGDLGVQGLAVAEDVAASHALDRVVGVRDVLAALDDAVVAARREDERPHAVGVRPAARRAVLDDVAADAVQAGERVLDAREDGVGRRGRRRRLADARHAGPGDRHGGHDRGGHGGHGGEADAAAARRRRRRHPPRPGARARRRRAPVRAGELAHALAHALEVVRRVRRDRRLAQFAPEIVVPAAQRRACGASLDALPAATSHEVCSLTKAGSHSSVRSRALAAARRDETVPSGTPTTSAAVR